MKDIGHIDAKKSLGQNFLNNPKISEWMADAGEVVSGDVVLEIGPGTGMLTRELLNRGASVIAIEADERAINELENTFSDEIADGRLSIRHGDIREISDEHLGVSAHEYKLVANIPYYISGYLFRRFLEGKNLPKILVFLVQKEVAERIARDEKESILSLSVKAFGEPKYVRTVSRGNFSPSPKVDSAILAVHNISQKNFCDITPEKFFEMLHLGFSARRKMLLGNLSKSYDRAVLENIFTQINIPSTARGEDVHLEKWLLLTQQLTHR